MRITDYLYTGIVINPNTFEKFEIDDNSLKNLKIKLRKWRKILAAPINHPSNTLDIIIHISDNRQAIKNNCDLYPIYTRIVRPSKFNAKIVIDITDNYKSCN